MKALIRMEHQKLYVVEEIGTKYHSVSGWCIRCGVVSGKRPSIGVDASLCIDVSEYFQNPENITRQEAEFFAMVYPNVKVFNVTTGEIYG